MLICKQMYSLVFATKPKIEQIKKKSLEKSASNIQTFVPIICIFTSGINFSTCSQMTFIIFSNGIICIVHGNDLKLCQVSLHKWQLYIGSLNNVTPY